MTPEKVRRALLEVRRYCEAHAMTYEVSGEEALADDWHEALRLLDAAEARIVTLVETPGEDPLRVQGLEASTGEPVVRGGSDGLERLVGEPVEPPSLVVEVERLVGRGWGMVRGLVRRR